jgi:hypothetical protein
MKTIYYSFIQKLEVPDNMTEKELDDLIFNHTFIMNGNQPADYIWSEKSNLFYED